jgi:hypothetical protein
LDVGGGARPRGRTLSGEQDYDWRVGGPQLEFLAIEVVKKNFSEDYKYQRRPWKERAHTIATEYPELRQAVDQIINPNEMRNVINEGEIFIFIHNQKVHVGKVIKINLKESQYIIELIDGTKIVLNHIQMQNRINLKNPLVMSISPTKTRVSNALQTLQQPLDWRGYIKPDPHSLLSYVSTGEDDRSAAEHSVAADLFANKRDRLAQMGYSRKELEKYIKRQAARRRRRGRDE